jgi:phosphoribosyl-ATP pyrophosphohydrolase/phosphoribosyl-AMP cyclohydrolase
MSLEALLQNLTFNQDGMITTVVQSAKSNRVLMVAWMNRESLAKTIETGETVFWSRSRQELWHKGETSGNVQEVVSIQADCDGDTLLILVNEAGAACHNGTESCFDTVEIFSATNQETE